MDEIQEEEELKNKIKFDIKQAEDDIHCNFIL